MPEAKLSEKLLDYLMSTIDGWAFEKLITDLMSIRHGHRFESMGGRKDGGADGLLQAVYSQSDKHYLQISREAGAEAKIERTIKRLREVGRTPTAVTFWTHREVPTRDIIEERLSEESGLTVRIRERSDVRSLVNESSDCIKHVKNVFKAQLDELVTIDNPPNESVSKFAKDPTVYAFLKFEVGERSDKTALLVPVVNALVYWALRDTDPDKGVLLTRADLKGRIAKVLPGAVNMVIPKVDPQLLDLCKKNHVGFQRVRYYTQNDSFCLPYDMRLQLATESADDRSLSTRVVESLKTRILEAGLTDKAEMVAAVTLDVIYRHFHEQGLVLAAFLEKRLETITTEDQILEVELNKSLDVENVSQKAYSAALSALRGFFYTPNDDELAFQKSLSRTSLLLTSLQHSPQILEYFNGMTGRFRILVGSDILVKALSEYFLPTEAKTLTNLLLAAKEAGAQLFLAETVLDEVFTHFHATHLEFRNHYAPRETFLTSVIASQSCRILIRAYFYAKAMAKVRGWRQYVETFVDFEPLSQKETKALDQLRGFLLKTFGLAFLSKDDLLQGVDKPSVDLLAEKLRKRGAEKNPALADNDALLAHAVYAQRRSHGETYKYDGFGMATWWLTKETLILGFTGELVRDNSATPYIMRPEFLLNFLALAPKALSGRARELLPTHVGLQLGQHLADAQMEKLLAAVEEWRDLPQERIDIRLGEFSDRLKYDRLKRHVTEVDLDNGNVFSQNLTQLRTVLADERKSL